MEATEERFKMIPDYLSDGITTVIDSNYSKYKKLEILSAYRFGSIYHCETEHEYLWIEVHLGNIVLDKAETLHEMGEGAEVIAKYKGSKPSFFEIVKHFNWEIDENNIWDG